MKLATILHEKGKLKVAVYDDTKKGFLDIHQAEKNLGNVTLPLDMISCIGKGDIFLQRVEELLEKCSGDPTCWISEEEAMLFAPIPRTSKNVFCIGKNYADHAIEMGSAADIPEAPIVFTKSPTSIIGHQWGIYPHRNLTNQLDYEGELAIVIGKEGINISKEDADEYIFGYTIINDVTARDRQRKHKQFFLGKTLDTHCPMGPYLVPKAYIKHPQNLSIETKVNGEIRQSGNTKDMIFSIAEIIATLSEGMTLEPGDVIATGTPSGVGQGMKPPKYLNELDTIEITVESIGTLRNQIMD